jgi:hypothetical protein
MNIKSVSNFKELAMVSKKHFSYIKDPSYVNEKDRGKEISKLF